MRSVAPGWAVSNINVGVLYLFAISSLGVYGIIMGGWASNSKYPFLGSLRSAAQMVSYEVSIGFVIVTVIVLAGTLNLQQIVTSQGGGFWNWYVLGGPGPIWTKLLTIVMAPMAGIFFISGLAETNRHLARVYRPDEVIVPSFLEDIPPVRREVAQYFTAVARMDVTFGEILAALKESGQAERTVVAVRDVTAACSGASCG